MFGRAVFEVIEVKGGHMVKDWDYVAEIIKINVKKIKYPTLLLCIMAIFLLEMGQNQQSPLKNFFCIFFEFILIFSASKSCSLTIQPPLTSVTSKTALPNIGWASF